MFIIRSFFRFQKFNHDETNQNKENNDNDYFQTSHPLSIYIYYSNFLKNQNFNLTKNRFFKKHQAVN